MLIQPNCHCNCESLLCNPHLVAAFFYLHLLRGETYRSTLNFFKLVEGISAAEPKHSTKPSPSRIIFKMGQYDRKAQSQPKHGKPSSSGASKAPILPPRSWPAWRGPGNGTKKNLGQQPAPSVARTSPASCTLDHIVPGELQQMMLDIFRDAFPTSDNPQILASTSRNLTSVLAENDSSQSSERDELLGAYAVRWSPSRALGLSNLLAWICEQNDEDAWVKRLIHGNGDDVAKLVCFGGGAAEIVACAGLLRLLIPGASGSPPIETLESVEVPVLDTPPVSPKFLELHLVDTVPWMSVISKLYAGLTNPPALSKYASAAARAANKSFLDPDALKLTFTQADILHSGVQNLCAMIGPNPSLLILSCIMTELYSVSVSEATAYLLRLTTAAPRGSLLLVIDCPISASEVGVGPDQEGEEKRKYPIQWLMTHVLLSNPDSGIANEDNKGPWEKVSGNENISYRPGRSLRYPVALEDMKFEVLLFRRL